TPQASRRATATDMTSMSAAEKRRIGPVAPVVTRLSSIAELGALSVELKDGDASSEMLTSSVELFRGFQRTCAKINTAPAAESIIRRRSAHWVPIHGITRMLKPSAPRI